MDFLMRSCYPQTAREDFSNWMGGGCKIQPMWAYPMMNIDKPSPGSTFFMLCYALFKCFLPAPVGGLLKFIALDLPLSWEIPV
jgi:hypothetical protein